MIGPNLRGVFPNNRSAGEELAINALPINIPPGRRYARPVMLAGARAGGGGRVPRRAPVEVAQLEEPQHRGGNRFGQQVALVLPPVAPPPAPAGGSRGFHLIASANAADAAPAHHGPAAPGQWAIQVGAFGNQGQAHSALLMAHNHAQVELAVAHPFVASVHQGRTTLWRARMTGMSRETAVQACEKITRGRSSCIVLSPETQS
jgi:hypothetical protein